MAYILSRDLIQWKQLTKQDTSTAGTGKPFCEKHVIRPVCRPMNGWIKNGNLYFFC